MPEGKIDQFSEFPPIFKNTEIKMEDIGEHMREFARSIQREKGAERSLISSMHGEELVLLSPLSQKYIEMGLECTGIECIIEYHPKKVFEWFRDEWQMWIQIFKFQVRHVKQRDNVLMVNQLLIKQNIMQ